MNTEQLYQIYRETNGISTDSRTVRKGEIFFALWGEKFNGNEFASEAIEKGAACAVVDDPAFESDKTILVDDCLIELQALAAHHRKELKASVLAITGTNGKTTTRELIAAIAARKFRVHSTKGNLNNMIGVPLTILSAPAGTELMILEMGASHIGEIRTLCLIARPDYGIITNIGVSHIEGFGSVEGVLKAKTELYEYLRKVNGIALYDDNDPILTEKIFKLINRAVPFSNPTGTELTVEYLPSGLNLNLKASYHHKTYNITTNLFGSYNLENIRVAIATGLFLGVEMDDIADAVGKYQPENNRSQIRMTGKNTLICDSYNANPVSMKLAIDSFARIKADRKLFILGDMLELGDKAAEEHLKILKELKKHKNDEVLLTGEMFQKFAADYGFKAFNDINALIDHLKNEPVNDYSVLVKASRGIALERIYQFL